jgi:hypothetical protein
MVGWFRARSKHGVCTSGGEQTVELLVLMLSVQLSIRHTLGNKDMTKNALKSTSVTTDDAISAFVPCVSKCCGHNGVHQGLVDRCLL